MWPSWPARRPTPRRCIPTTAGRTLDVTATGAAGVDWANVENPTATVGLSGTTVKDATDATTAIAVLNNLSAAAVNSEVDTALADYDGPTNAEMVARTLAAASYATEANVTAVGANVTTALTRLPSALVSGRMDSSVGAMAANVLTAAATAADFGTEVAAAVGATVAGATFTVDNRKQVAARTVKLGTRADGVWETYPPMCPSKGDVLPWWVDCKAFTGDAWLDSATNPVSSDEDAVTVPEDDSVPRLGVNRELIVIWLNAVGTTGHDAADITLDLTPDGGETVKVSIPIEVQNVTAA